MAAITYVTMVALLDKTAAAWIAGLGTDASTYGTGTIGATARAYGKAGDVQDLIIATADPDQIEALIPGANALVAGVDAYASLGRAAQAWMSGLDQVSRRAAISGVQTLYQFLSYYNTGAGGPWLALAPQEFGELYYGARNQRLTAANVYREVLQGSTYSNGLRKLIVGTGQTAGQDIDSSLHAGGFGQIKWSGATGSGVVTVTGTWRTVAGVIVTGHGTASLSGSSGTATLTPPSTATGGLLVTVTAIAAAAGVTAGTIYAEATKPSGRTNPPT